MSDPFTDTEPRETTNPFAATPGSGGGFKYADGQPRSRPSRPVRLNGPAGAAESEPSEGSTGTDTGEGDNRPRGRMPTREPRTQNEHMRKIAGSHKLREFPRSQHVAMALHVHMGAAHGKQFGVPTQAAAEFLHDITGWSVNACRAAMAHAVECGFYRRVDNGKGGRKGKGGATYVPTVPDYS